VIDCLYRRLGADGDFEFFESTDGTRSNWDPEIQHGSPPLALMTKLAHLFDGRRDVRSASRRHRAGGRPRHGVAAGDQRHPTS
jgi:hypothetical protein